jgi:hypothetical protein
MGKDFGKTQHSSYYMKKQEMLKNEEAGDVEE